MESDNITTLGECNFRNKRIKFGIKTDDRRRHIYIIGKTGSGKTTMMENMIIDDVHAGKGVALIDPHGDFAQKILNFIPEDRVNDVIYFNPQDIDFPIAFNPLEQVTNEHRHLIASGLMAVFEKIWPDVWSARMQYILNNTLLALLEFPNTTLLGIMRMLSDKKYRKEVVNNLSDPVVKSFWINEFGQYEQRFAVEAVAAILNKVGQFVANPLIRNVIGQPHSSLKLRKVMDEGKILIANLSKGAIGEDNSNLLGGMLITRLQMAAMSRVDTPEDDRRDFYLYIDEFQNFSTESFANILSEARKYRLNLTLAHQYIAQLVGDNTTVRDAIFGNVGTFVIFRVGAYDAEFVEPEFAPTFDQSDFVNLPSYNVYTRLMIDGIAGKPFSAVSLPPHKVDGTSHADVIIENTRQKYAVPKETVEKKISQEWESDQAKAVQEKVERRGEKGLHVLKNAPPPQRKKKKKVDIDKGKLREALNVPEKKEEPKEEPIVAQEAETPKEGYDPTRDKSTKENQFAKWSSEFVSIARDKLSENLSGDEASIARLDGMVGNLAFEERRELLAGSYLGEVVRSTLGAKWKWSDKNNRWVVSLVTKDGDEIENDVFQRINDRMIGGRGESLVEFYSRLKILIEKGFEAFLQSSVLEG